MISRRLNFFAVIINLMRMGTKFGCQLVLKLIYVDPVHGLLRVSVYLFLFFFWQISSKLTNGLAFIVHTQKKGNTHKRTGNGIVVS